MSKTPTADMTEDDASSRGESDIKPLAEKCLTKTEHGGSMRSEKRDTSQDDDKGDDKEGLSSKIGSKETGNVHQNTSGVKKETLENIEIATQDTNDTKHFPNSVVQCSESKPVVAYSQNGAAESTRHFKQQMLETFRQKFEAIIDKYFSQMEQNALQEILINDLTNIIDDVLGMVNRMHTLNSDCEEKKVSERASKKNTRVLKEKLESELSGTSTDTDHGERALSNKSKRVLREKLESELSDTDQGKQPKHKKIKIEKNVENFIGPRSSEGNMDKKSSVKGGIVVKVEVRDLNSVNTNHIGMFDDSVKVIAPHCSNNETSDAGKNDIETLDLPDVIDEKHVGQKKNTKRLGVVVKNIIKGFKSIKDKKECYHFRGKLEPFQYTDKLKKNLKLCLQNNNLLSASTSANLVSKKSLVLNKGLKQEIKVEPTLFNVPTRGDGRVTMVSADSTNAAGTVRSNTSNFDSSGNVEINLDGQYMMSDMGQLNTSLEENTNNRQLLGATSVESNITSALNYNVYNNNSDVLERQNQPIESTTSSINNRVGYCDNNLGIWYNENRNQYTGRQNYYDYGLGSSFNNNYCYQPGAQGHYVNYSGNTFDQYQLSELPDCNVQRYALNNSLHRNANYNSWNATRTMPQLVINGISSVTQVGNVSCLYPLYNGVNVGHAGFLNRNVTTAIPNVQNGTFNCSSQLCFQQHPDLMTHFGCIYNIAENGNSSVSGTTLPQEPLPSVLTIHHSSANLHAMQ